MPINLEFQGERSSEMQGGFPLPGIYHVLITEIDEQVEQRDGSIMDGFKATFEVLAGTCEHQEKKRFSERFQAPAPTHKDGGKYCHTRLKILAIAAGLIEDGATGAFSLEPAELQGMQLVVGVKNRTYDKDDGTQGVSTELDRLEMHHVLSPKVADVPKDPTFISILTGEPIPDEGGGEGGEEGGEELPPEEPPFEDGGAEPEPDPEPAPQPAKPAPAAARPAAAAQPATAARPATRPAAAPAQAAPAAQPAAARPATRPATTAPAAAAKPAARPATRPAAAGTAAKDPYANL